MERQKKVQIAAVMATTKPSLLGSRLARTPKAIVRKNQVFLEKLKVILEGIPEGKVDC
jgi:hypothetical protein